MAIPADVLEVGDELARVWQQAWEAIVAEQESTLLDVAAGARRARLAELRAAVERILAGLDVDTRSWIQGRLPVIYQAGAEAGATFTWTTFHTEAVQRLASDLFDDLLARTSFVRADTKRFVRDALKLASELKATTGRTAVQSARQAAADLVDENGITGVVYRNGAKVGIDTYAEMALRTKTAVAYNAGTLNAASEAGFQFFEVLDGPQCGWEFHDDTQLANGMIVTADEAAAFPVSHPNCVMEGTPVAFYGGLVELVRAWYSGRCYRLTVATPTGLHTLTVGPHHPVLTRSGWESGGLVDEGDELIYDRWLDHPRQRGLESQLEQMPLIEDVFDACAATGSRTLAPATSDDLHGDGMFCQGEIEVVRPTRELLPVCDPSVIEQAGEGVLVGSDADLKLVATACVPLPRLGGNNSAPGASVRRVEHRSRLLGRDSLPPETHGLALRSAHSSLAEDSPHRWSSDTEVGGDLVTRLPGHVAGDNDVGIDPTTAGPVAVDRRRPVGSVRLDGDGLPASGAVADGRLFAAMLLAAPVAAIPPWALDREQGAAVVASQHRSGHRFVPVRVVAVAVEAYDGWVYDATTTAGTFAGTGCMIRNCRRSFAAREFTERPDGGRAPSTTDAQNEDQAAFDAARQQAAPTRPARTPRQPRALANA